ncbi:Aste57867_1876 [Aphanomyces stellatus]|uniref:Aste57867_1876 protein n=1 Tax=Aphanomyces stellatus TaxID=120398 RepID=A0A485K796_9STRA|nr:hypothetical protein As57867_001874 [Aphanomyces stellatus]VFT79083.1 Aste57867_1876 [Aphanomyces stellatus]
MTSSAADLPSIAPSNNDDSAFSWNEILRVQNLIERCLQQSMSQVHLQLLYLILKFSQGRYHQHVAGACIHVPHAQANVDPNFTRTVWQKLEEQNPSFFQAYTLHMTLKEQILTFNYLVDQQREMEKGGATFKATDDQRLNAPTHHSMAPLLSPIKTDLDTCAFFT